MRILHKWQGSYNAILICPHCLTSVSDGIFTRKRMGNAIYVALRRIVFVVLSLGVTLLL